MKGNMTTHTSQHLLCPRFIAFRNQQGEVSVHSSKGKMRTHTGQYASRERFTFFHRQQDAHIGTEAQCKAFRFDVGLDVTRRKFWIALCQKKLLQAAILCKRMMMKH